MSLNRNIAWQMFVMVHTDELRWEQFASFDLPEVPVVGVQYWLEKDVTTRYYRVTWVDHQHQHFGVMWES